VREEYSYRSLPFSRGFSWPQITAHTALAQRFINMIPASASVSAQSSLIPHISERNSIYLFPYQDDSAEYIFLDTTSFYYPLQSLSYINQVKKLIMGGNYGEIGRASCREREKRYKVSRRGIKK